MPPVGCSVENYVLWPPFDAREGSGASGRPLVALSFALNHAWGGLEPFGYQSDGQGGYLPRGTNPDSEEIA